VIIAGGRATGIVRAPLYMEQKIRDVGAGELLW